MRNARVALCTGFFLVAWACTAGAGEWAETMFSQGRTHDFGTVAGGAKAEHEFAFVNGFLEDIRLLDVKSTCGCTTPLLKGEKRLFATGEKGAIVAHLNSERFRGKKGATLTVRFDVPSRPDIPPSAAQLQVRSNISNLTVEYDCVWFGSIDLGSAYEQTVRILVPPELRRLPLTVSADNEDLKAEVVPGQTAGGYSLKVTVPATAKPGFFPEMVMLQVGNQRFPLEVVGQIRPPLSVTPASLSLFVAAGDKATRNLVVRATEPVQISAIHCDDTRFLLKTPEGGPAKKVHIIPVTYLAGPRKGRFDSLIRLDFADGQASKTVQAHVEVREPKMESLAGQ